MDNRTGDIYLENDMREKFTGAEIKENFQTINPTPRQMNRRKVGRNERCPCGFGHKFKKCCLIKKGVPYKSRRDIEKTQQRKDGGDE